MPELAEVAIYARDLNRSAQSGVLKSVTFHPQKPWGEIIIPPLIQRRFEQACDSPVAFCSEGKALLLQVPNLEKILAPIVEFRFGMTGRFYAESLAEKWQRHCFLELNWAGSRIYYVDPRRFGRLSIPQENLYAIGGYRPDQGFWLRSRLKVLPGYQTVPRISWLLRGGRHTGVGNYMANEALGRLDLSPFTPGTSEAEAVRLLEECQAVAQASFLSDGNSFSGGYYRLDGTQGSFIQNCQFYGSKEVPCYSFRGRPVFTKHPLPAQEAS
jgi:formamidopyrimidine-DNA glycosylase